MCSKRDVCFDPGYGFSSGAPVFGWNMDGETRIAVADAPDTFLAVGLAFVNQSDVCKSYREQNNGETPPVALQECVL